MNTHLEVENSLFPVGVLVIGSSWKANAALCLAELALEVEQERMYVFISRRRQWEVRFKCQIFNFDLENMCKAGVVRNIFVGYYFPIRPGNMKLDYFWPLGYDRTKNVKYKGDHAEGNILALIRRSLSYRV